MNFKKSLFLPLFKNKPQGSGERGCNEDHGSASLRVQLYDQEGGQGRQECGGDVPAGAALVQQPAAGAARVLQRQLP